VVVVLKDISFCMCFQAPMRNHPLLLLSGVATNAIGYDLSPEVTLFPLKNHRALFWE